jgi:methylated-DNA-[protein]-cysteine S-methyltransferase
VPWGKVPTVFGDFLAEWDGKGLRRLLFPRDFSAGPWEEAPILEILRRELNEYFLGERATFSVPLSLSGPPFFLRVWEELLRIPYGERITYGELAFRIGRPRAARAVGQALAENPLPILIPCHRVVGKRGLGGFGPGLGWKKRLLELEQTYREKFSPR